MLKDLTIAIKRAVSCGDKKVSNFSGLIPGEYERFTVGDVFTLPTEYTVFEERIGCNSNQYIFVENQVGEIRKLYPSQLSRVVRNCYTHELHTAHGTASQLYKMHGTVADGMEALKGKTIRVSNVEVFPTVLPGNIEGHKSVYTFDLV